jgi:SAM-dependent methyltransferase
MPRASDHHIVADYRRFQAHNAALAWHHSRRYLALARIVRGANLGWPVRVLDIGCGDAAVFPVLDACAPIEYVGIDSSAYFVPAARESYGACPNFSALHLSALDLPGLLALSRPDIVAALETLEHIPDDDVARVIANVAALRPTVFVCSVPVEVGPAVWAKNIASFLMRYHRHREYSWRETFWAGLYRLPEHRGTHKGFDWRKVTEEIGRHMRIQRIERFPSQLLPAALSASVFIVAAPKEDIEGRTQAAGRGPGVRASIPQHERKKRSPRE